MNWWKTATQPRFRVERNGLEFTAYLGNQEIGCAFLSNYKPNGYYLEAIDIYDHSEDGGPNFQRKGYGTLLMKAIRDYLHGVGAEFLSSSNEGSGTVQMLDKTFGRENVTHTHAGEDVDYETAKKIMDVDYGYTRSQVSLKPQSKKITRPQ